jgi:Cysteine protease
MLCSLHHKVIRQQWKIHTSRKAVLLWWSRHVFIFEKTKLMQTQFTYFFHSRLLVGYNDEFRVDTGSFGDLNSQTTGGFIIKNSWGPSTGHSMKYWSQEISQMDENLICPNELSPSTWVPANVSCMEENADPVKCNKLTKRRIRDQWVYGATPLVCTETGILIY